MSLLSPTVSKNVNYPFVFIDYMLLVTLKPLAGVFRFNNGRFFVTCEIERRSYVLKKYISGLKRHGIISFAKFWNFFRVIVGCRVGHLENGKNPIEF